MNFLSPKLMTILFCLLFLASSTYGEVTQVKGVGETREEALKQALANAVSRVAGVEVRAFTKLVNTLLEDAVVTKEIMGEVRSYKILDEGKNEAGAYWVEIEAEVGELEKTTREMVRLIQDILGKVKVVVVLNEWIEEQDKERAKVFVVETLIESKADERGGSRTKPVAAFFFKNNNYFISTFLSSCIYID